MKELRRKDSGDSESAILGFLQGEMVNTLLFSFFMRQYIAFIKTLSHKRYGFSDYLLRKKNPNILSWGVFPREK